MIENQKQYWVTRRAYEQFQAAGAILRDRVPAEQNQHVREILKAQVEGIQAQEAELLADLKAYEGIDSQNPPGELDSLLIPKEWAVYDHLTDAFNAFLELPQFHISDAQEFTQGINACKNILMSRPVARELINRQHNGYINAQGEVIGDEVDSDDPAADDLLSSQS